MSQSGAFVQFRLGLVVNHNDPKIQAKLENFLQHFGTIVLPFFELTKDKYKDATPDEKTQMDKSLSALCPAFLTTPEYRSGDTNDIVYKLCCDMVDYCSFMKQPWFMLVAVAGGLILLNIISVGLLTCFFCCKKKGPPGSSVPKTPKTEKTGKSKESGKSKTSGNSGKSGTLY